MRSPLLAALLCCLATAAVANDGKLDYEHQEKWTSALDKAQSPIDIVTAKAEPAADDEPQGLQIWHSVAPVDKVEDNGHAIQVDSHTTEAMIRGRHFRLAQFHFHAESEHTIDGKHYPLEGHFVFKAQDGRLAVVGVMFQEGQANAAAQSIIDDLKPGAAQAQHSIDIGALLPKTRGYYHYLGSLTTPPLTENVEWYVMPAPVTLSKAQIDAFQERYKHNNRKVQPLNGRPVIHAAS
jgi:carbonic anhydrase